MSIDIVDIFAETNKIYESILDSKPHTKYYHLKSLHNFMVHFDELRSMQDKYIVHDLFRDCANYLQDNFITDSKSSLEFFKKFIKPMGKIYVHQAKFTSAMGLPGFIPLLIIGNLWVLLAGSHTRSFIIFNSIIFILICRDLILRKGGRVYGFNY